MEWMGFLFQLSPVGARETSAPACAAGVEALRALF